MLILIMSLSLQSVFSQVPSKKEMQAQMLESVNEVKKQISELDKQIAKAESPDEVKNLQEQKTMLNKQLEMMQGLNKNISGMSEKIFKDAAEQENSKVPKKDFARINSLPKRTFNDAEALLFLRNMHEEVEKTIPAAEKQEALKMYNETKEKYKSADVTGNAASGCWMLGHWEKALYIMGRVCIDDMSNTDNLNNYAAFLTMTGAEQAAIPILEYLNKLYPDNSTILNNLGQAWFGLGDMMNAKKYLINATNLYDNHSQANGTLAEIYKSEGNTAAAIAVLKKAIKETYDPEKEHALNRLGVNLTYADLPELNYPMKEDPTGLIPFINILPENYPSAIGDDQSVDAIDRYLNGVSKLKEELAKEDETWNTKFEEHARKLVSDRQYNFDYIEAHNTPGYKLAKRSMDLLIAERLQGVSPLPAHLLSAGFFPLGRNENVVTHWEIILQCEKIWQDSVVESIAALALAMRSAGRAEPTCSEIDAVTNAYLAKSRQIYQNGTRLIKQLVRNNKKQLTKWSKIYLYGTMDTPPDNTDDLTSLLIGNLEFSINRKRMRNEQLESFLGLAEKIVQRQGFIKSSCDPGSDKNHTDDADDLQPLKVDLDCEFKKVVNVPAVVYTFTCNTKKEEPKGLKKRKPDVPKGSASNSRQRSQTRNRGPLGGGNRGPSFFSYEPGELEIMNEHSGPLNAEDKDPSQFSMEYDRWGNIIDIKFQLNEDGTGLADPDSKETDIYSRWSWVASGNINRGVLRQLTIKTPGPVVRSPKTTIVPGTVEPAVINRTIKTDLVKPPKDNYDFSNIRICIDVDQNVSLPIRPAFSFPEILPKIKPDGELETVVSRKDELAGYSDLMWLPGETITVGMDTTTFHTGATVVNKVKQFAKKWETVANIHFEFISDFANAQVKIGFDPSKGSWSWLGRRVLYNLIGENTMNLGWFTDKSADRDFQTTTLHEFGHVLGFIHEHQSPAAGIPWDKEKVYAYMTLKKNLTRTEVDNNIFAKYATNHINASIYDKSSIMHYFFPSELTLDGSSFSQNTDLSIMDKAFVGIVYPFPPQPSDASGVLQTGDDCDEILFSVAYNAVDPNIVEFILEPGLDHHGNKVTWWKGIGIPAKGGVEIKMEMADGSSSTMPIPISIIEKDKGISFSKAKFLGVHTPLSYKWNVLPAITGGSRVRLTWRRDTCQ